MKKTILILLLPIIIATEMYLFSFITESLSAKSDMSVFAGVGSLVIFILLNYLLINYTKKQFKN